MGLLDNDTDLFTPDAPCKFGLILAGRQGNVTGETLEPDDIEGLARRRAMGAGSGRIRDPLLRAGFTIGTSTVQRHLAGGCMCPDDTPLKGSPRGSAR